jgi:lipid A 4'-phosphatase
MGRLAGELRLFTTISWRMTGWFLIGAIGAFSLLFLAVPEIDLWSSALFFDEADRFSHARNPVFGVIRKIFMYGLTLVALLTIVFLIRSLSIGKRRAVSLNVWGFMVASIMVGPIGFVNGILKSYWGRARPADVEYFGGDKFFTPPMIITDQCETNCSFVSGEGSAIATALIVLAIVLWGNMTALWRAISLYVVLPMSLFGISLRIITGRHFLSDTVFGALYCALIIWAFYRLFKMSDHLNDLTWTSFKKDMSKA